MDEMMAKGPMYNRIRFLEGLGRRELEECLQEFTRQGLDGDMKHLIIRRLAVLEREAKHTEQISERAPAQQEKKEH